MSKKAFVLDDTKSRLLGAAEALFIESGYEALLLREITKKANANLASVNYHFGDKEGLMKVLLSQRLEPLNERRLALLTVCQNTSESSLECEAVLGILFAPALELERSGEMGGEETSFIRFLCRVYSDTSPFVQTYLHEHYAPVFTRFFEAFADAVPELPRHELGLRLQFALKAIAGVMAGTELRLLMNAMSLGQPTTDIGVMAKLIALVSASIKAPLSYARSQDALEGVLRIQRSGFVRLDKVDKP